MTDTENDPTTTTTITGASVEAPTSGSAVTDEVVNRQAVSDEGVTDAAGSADAADVTTDGESPDKASPDEASPDKASPDKASPDGDDDADGDNPLETEAEIAADYLEELLDIADLDGDIDTFIEGDRAHVWIVSESQVLVGTDGRVLDALQELARLAVMTETGDRSRLMLDVAGYRERRRQELVLVAGDAVEEVKSTDASVALAPMNPFERKIVHDAVAAAGLTSASEGEEPRRHVVVRPSA